MKRKHDGQNSHLRNAGITCFAYIGLSLLSGLQARDIRNVDYVLNAIIADDLFEDPLPLDEVVLEVLRLYLPLPAHSLSMPRLRSVQVYRWQMEHSPHVVFQHGDGMLCRMHQACDAMQASGLHDAFYHGCDE